LWAFLNGTYHGEKKTLQKSDGQPIYLGLRSFYFSLLGTPGWLQKTFNLIGVIVSEMKTPTFLR